LKKTIDAAAADVVVSATPCDLAALIEINKPVVRASYEFAEMGKPLLSGLIEDFLKQKNLLSD